MRITIIFSYFGVFGILRVFYNYSEKTEFFRSRLQFSYEKSRQMRIRNSINEDKNTMNENRCKRRQVLHFVGDLRNVVGDLRIPNALSVDLQSTRVKDPLFSTCGFGNPQEQTTHRDKRNETFLSIQVHSMVRNVIEWAGIVTTEFFTLNVCSIGVMCSSPRSL